MSKSMSVKALLCCIWMTCGLVEVAVACDQKCKRLVEKSAARYEKAIIKAETKGCKHRPILTTAEKSCARSMASIDKQYGKFKDYVKQHADIKVLKNRHDNLHLLLAGFREEIQVNKITSLFNESILKMESTCTILGSHDTCYEMSEIAKNEYKKFSSKIQDIDEIKTKMKKHSLLLLRNKELENQYNEKRDSLLASDKGSSLYYQTRSKISGVTRILKMGRDGKGDISLASFSLIKELKVEIEEFKENCEGIFLEVKSQYSDDIKESCDLMKNFDKYLVEYKNNTAKKYHDNEYERLSRYVDKLKNEGKMYESEFNTLMYNFSSYKKKLRADTSFVDLDMTRFDEMHDDFKDALKISLKNNDWDDFVGEDMHDDFEGYVESYAKRNNFDYIKGSYGKKFNWKISKNSLGVPLYKYIGGYLMFQHDSDSEHRMYSVTFYRDYQGGGEYASASRIKVDPYVMPVYK